MRFSNSTGLSVNPAKCRAYYGSVPAKIKQEMETLTTYSEGPLPFRYLGVPLSSKKLFVHHCMLLVDKIVTRIRHWSAKLLSYAGRLQLIRSVVFAVTNFWMQCFPLPKKIIKKIEAICRSFLWSGGSEITRKSPISWSKVCSSRKQGGQSHFFV